MDDEAMFVPGTGSASPFSPELLAEVAPQGIFSNQGLFDFPAVSRLL